MLIFYFRLKWFNINNSIKGAAIDSKVKATKK